MLPFMLKNLTKYLSENLSKGCITLLQIFHLSSVLFSPKPNINFRFYFDYQKLSAIIKWNRYFFSQIDEFIGKIIGYKHFTKLDVN